MAEYEKQHEQGALDFYTDSADLFWQAWKGIYQISWKSLDGIEVFETSLLISVTECCNVAAPEGSDKETLKKRLADVMARAEDLKGVSLNPTPVSSKSWET